MSLRYSASRKRPPQPASQFPRRILGQGLMGRRPEARDDDGGVLPLPLLCVHHGLAALRALPGTGQVRSGCVRVGQLT